MMQETMVVLGARALMTNLRILMMPKFENYSCHICGHKLDSKQSPADYITASTSAALLITSGICYWTPVTKLSHYLPSSELLFPHRSSTFLVYSLVYFYVLYRVGHAEMKYPMRSHPLIYMCMYITPLGGTATKP